MPAGSPWPATHFLAALRPDQLRLGHFSLRGQFSAAVAGDGTGSLLPRGSGQVTDAAFSALLLSAFRKNSRCRERSSSYSCQSHPETSDPRELLGLGWDCQATSDNTEHRKRRGCKRLKRSFREKADGRWHRPGSPVRALRPQRVGSTCPCSSPAVWPWPSSSPSAPCL